MAVENKRMWQRGALEADLLAADEVPADREMIVASDTGRVWTGDGVSPLSARPFLVTADPMTGQMPDDVRETIAKNLADLTTPEGAAAASIAGIVNDEAVAGYIGSDGASATKAALLAITDSRFGRKQGVLEFSDDYSLMADGAPGESLTGQAYSLHSARKPSGLPVISSGYLTYADTDYLGGYATVEFERSLVRFGASFAFTPWTTGGGLACIAAMSDDIGRTSDAGLGVPAAPFHLTISPEAWGVDVFQTTGSSPTPIAGGLFNPPLVADSETLHRVEVVLDQDNAVAYVTLPNGERKTISNPYMTTPARYAFIEPYRDTSGSGKTRALFRSFWGDSRNGDVIPAAKASARARPSGVVVVENMPGTQSDVTINTTPTKVPGVSVNYVVPDSGAVLVTLEGLLDVTAAGPVYFGIMDETNSLTAVRTVATKQTNGRMALRLPVSTGSPGQTKTASMCVYLGGSAAAKLLLGNYGSPAVYAGASIMVTPA